MTVVYVDALFLLNLFLNYGLLLAAARVAGAAFIRLRLLIGALLGALYAVSVFLPGLSFLAAFPIKLAAAALMLLCAFGGQRHFLRILLVFLALSFALGGGVMAMTMAGGRTLYQGVLRTVADLKTVLLAAAGCYFLASTVFRRALRHAPQRELVRVRLTVEGRNTEFSVLLDTGNTLTDGGNRPVLVAEWQAVRELFPPGLRPTADDVKDPVAGMSRFGAQWDQRRVRLLPYRAVGTQSGLLLALRVDEAEVEGERRGGMLVALSPGPVSDGGAYQGLLGCAG